MTNARGKIITNKRVDITTQNAAAQMLCCLEHTFYFLNRCHF